MMNFTNYFFDHVISQDISKLTEFNAHEVSSRYPQRKMWLPNFYLNSTFGGKLSDEGKVFCLFFLRRTEAAFVEYEYACEALNTFINTTPMSPYLYFKALHHFEVVLSMLYQAYELGRQFTGIDFFQGNDGSSHQRLNAVYNAFRHFTPIDASPGNLHIIWLTNVGVKTEKKAQTNEITYSEIEEFLIEVGNMADELSKAGR